jgi:hypothetical protein
MALPLPKAAPQEPEPLCLNCRDHRLYGGVCDRCGLCQRCNEFALEDCYCVQPTAVERHALATVDS